MYPDSVPAAYPSEANFTPCHLCVAQVLGPQCVTSPVEAMCPPAVLPVRQVKPRIVPTLRAPPDRRRLTLNSPPPLLT